MDFPRPRFNIHAIDIFKERNERDFTLVDFFRNSILLALRYGSTGNIVESHYNEPASNGNPPLTEAILESFEFLFIFYIGNNRNPPITDKNGWSLEIC